MKFTYNWIKRFLDTKLSPEELAVELTNLGLEVESAEDRSKDLSEFTVAMIEDVIQHPNADKLRICSVNNGSEILQIVCGAPNARKGIKVVLAHVGAKIPNGEFIIRASEIRGVKSNGMLCSADELSITDIAQDGIIELPIEAQIGDSILGYLGIDDVVFYVSVTPNRGDWLGVYGIARDLAARKLGALKELETVTYKGEYNSLITAEIESCDASLLTLREIRNIKNCDSPAWLQNLLKLVGIHPISAIVDVTNYFSISFAQPMHAYDAKKIGKKISVRNCSSDSNNETIFSALNGKEYKIGDGDLIVSDENGPVALAGVIGGLNSKCDESTDAIILESAVFDKVAVAKLGRKHNIITDSRSRFERGVDDNNTENLAQMAAYMIQDICGGEVSAIVKTGNAAHKSEIIYYFSLTANRVGLNISHEESLSILTDLGFKILKENSDSALLQVPSWRHDINCPEIIAEEIARIKGYDQIVNSILPDSRGFKRLLTPEQKRLECIRRQAAALGYNESITYSFMSSKIAMGFAKFQEELRIQNPISSELDYLRPSIVPNLLDAVLRNNNRSINDIFLFEIGPVFSGLEKDDEALNLTIVASGYQLQKSHADLPRKYDFFDLKSDLECLITEAGFDASKLQITASAPVYYHPGRSITYKLGNKIIAYVGEIHPANLELFGIETTSYACEIFVNNIPVARSKFGKRQKVILSQYQEVNRDFAFLLPKEIDSIELVKLIRNTDILIKNAAIFDLYQGDKIDPSKKSIAVSVKIQSDETTLKDHEIEAIAEKIITEAKIKLNAELRGA